MIAWDHGVMGAAFANTNYAAQSGEENIEPSLLTIVNHTIQCTNTNTDDAGNA